MIGSVRSGAILLATLLLLGLPACGQEQPQAPHADSQTLPDAPRAGAPTDRATQGAAGKAKKSNSRPGFPPISPPVPGISPVAPASRPNIFGVRSECRPDSSSPAETMMSCQPNIPMFSRFLDSSAPLPLTSRQKLILAARNVSDPFNLLTIGSLSAISIASDAHTHDGPGFPGFAKNAGVSLSQDMVGEFFGTFLIPSLAHQDPHYHRMPNLSLKRRILHVLDEVVIAQSDHGTPMFNYATVVGTICSSSLGNVYVPGRTHSFGASAARISTALATDPIGNAITEFVPDLARHVNFQVVVVQRLINRVAIAEGAPPQ